MFFHELFRTCTHPFGQIFTDINHQYICRSSTVLIVFTGSLCWVVFRKGFAILQFYDIIPSPINSILLSVEDDGTSPGIVPEPSHCCDHSNRTNDL